MNDLISRQPEKRTEERTETHACDCIERQAAIDLVRDVCNAVMSGCKSLHDPETKDEVYEDIREVDAILKCNKEVRIALRNMPSAQQDCTECEDYDHETKSCPKFCDVIRRTLEEAKQERMGRWIYDGYAFKGGIDWMHCSECGHKDCWSAATRTPFCAWCGARMECE